MKKKKFPKISIIISSVILLLSAAILITVISARREGREPKIFGLSFHIVLTDSMTPEIAPGDFVLAATVDIADIKVGDNIIFKSADPALGGKNILHRVVAVSGENEISITTSGIKEGATEDAYPVTEDGLIGRYVFHSAAIGKVLIFLLDIKRLALIIIIAAAVAFAVKQVINIVRLSRDDKKTDIK